MRTALYSLTVACGLALLLCTGSPVKSARGEALVMNSLSGASGAAGERPGLAVMPKQCRLGKTSPAAFGLRWRQGSVVRVYYLKGDFDAAQAQALSRSVQNWNAALREIDAPILFIFGGERASVAREDASLTVARGIPTKKERLGELRFFQNSAGVTRMLMTVRPVVTDPDALTSLMTHELGHTLGLADCYECKRGTTAMSAFKDDNKGNDVYEPSACDKYVVAAGYATQAVAQEAPLLRAGRE